MVPTIGDSRATLRAPVVSRSQRAGPRPAQIVRSLPAGARVAPTQHAWLRALEEHPATAQLRADAHAHLLAVAEVLAWTADWRSKTTRPTWSRLCDRTGLGRRTVARWVAWLRAADLLGVVESGSTPQLRPMALAHLEGNRAALYVLATPSRSVDQAEDPMSVVSVDETGTPSDLTEGECPTHARGEAQQSPLRGPDSRKAAQRTAWRWTETTTHGRGRLGCAQRLQERVPALRGLSDRHLRHLLRPWLVAGWTAADVVWAIDHAPDGQAHTWTTDVRSPKGWLSHRLRQWLDAAGAPLRPLSAATAEAVTKSRSEQELHRAESAAIRAQLDQERALVEQLRDQGGDLWTSLLAAVTRRIGRRRPGPMSEALAHAAVLSALPVAAAIATPEQLLEALATAVDQQAAA